MRTRLRRWYWSAIRPGGHPLEYVGDPIEKLLGFLFAVVVLAFYIGIVNLVLMFFSFALFNGNTARGATCWHGPAGGACGSGLNPARGAMPGAPWRIGSSRF